MDPIFCFGLFISNIVFGFIAAAMMKDKGRPAFGGFIVGFIFNILGIVIIACVSKDENALIKNDVTKGLLKICPYCRKPINSLAIVCPYCRNSQSNTNETKKVLIEIKPTAPNHPNIYSYWHNSKDSLELIVNKKLPELPSSVIVVKEFGIDSNVLREKIINGTKKAISKLQWEYSDQKKSLPMVGDLSIIVNETGLPFCIVQLSEVRITPFNIVDDDFIIDECLKESTSDYWRQTKREEFSRICSEIGRFVEENMPIICYRFKVLIS
jgi:uncharacterized protein YhfF